MVALWKRVGLVHTLGREKVGDIREVLEGMVEYHFVRQKLLMSHWEEQKHWDSSISQRKHFDWGESET